MVSKASIATAIGLFLFTCAERHTQVQLTQFRLYIFSAIFLYEVEDVRVFDLTCVSRPGRACLGMNSAPNITEV